jgi:SecD/SecF fusion protein
MYAAILIFGVTLTLPGFAGLILTIGVAADANVVIFERIKEEVRAGQVVRAAIAAGYAKGFHTIIDANVVTAITALVLFAVATAGVKGFALMLLIGTVISLSPPSPRRAPCSACSPASAGSTTRASWARAAASGEWLQIDFMGGAAVVRDLGRRHPDQRRLARRQGLNLGIDFKGGDADHVHDAAADVADEVRDQARRSASATPSSRARAASSGDSTRVPDPAEALDAGEQTTLHDDLDELNAQMLGVKNVSSSFGRRSPSARSSRSSSRCC